MLPGSRSMDLIDPQLSALNPKRENGSDNNNIGQHLSMKDNETPFAGERRGKLSKKGTKRSKVHDSQASPLRQLGDNSGISDVSDPKGAKTAKKGKRLGIRPAKKKSKHNRNHDTQRQDMEEEKVPARVEEVASEDQDVSNDLP